MKHRIIRGADLPGDSDQWARDVDWLFDAESSDYVAVSAGVADGYAAGDAADAELDDYLAGIRKGLNMTPRLPADEVEV